MKRQLAIYFLVTLIAFQCPSQAESEDAIERFEPEFYAFFNGLPKGLSFSEEATLLKELGYDGISQVYGREGKLEERVAAFQKVGVKVLSIYQPATEEPIELKAVKALADGGMIELTVKTITPAIVASLRQTAEMAAGLRIRVVLYPHFGDAIATMEEAMALAEEVNHSNLGVMFNLCHYLRSEKAADLESALAKAGAKLFSVSTSGADLDGKTWNELIQTLDQGTFPQERLFRALQKMNFKGPVGLQCYAIPGDKAKNLKASHNAWQAMVEKMD